MKKVYWSILLTCVEWPMLYICHRNFSFLPEMIVNGLHCGCLAKRRNCSPLWITWVNHSMCILFMQFCWLSLSIIMFSNTSLSIDLPFLILSISFWHLCFFLFAFYLLDKTSRHCNSHFIAYLFPKDIKRFLFLVYIPFVCIFTIHLTATYDPTVYPDCNGENCAHLYLVSLVCFVRDWLSLLLNKMSSCSVTKHLVFCSTLYY